MVSLSIVIRHGRQLTDPLLGQNSLPMLLVLRGFIGCFISPPQFCWFVGDVLLFAILVVVGYNGAVFHVADPYWLQEATFLN